jgi:hypothetical protein
MPLDAAEISALRESCTTFLAGHGPVTAAGLLATIPADSAVDRYGGGGVVAALENEIAGLLGKPAAVFMPGAGAGRSPSTRCAIWSSTRDRRTGGCTSYTAARPEIRTG